MMRDGPLRRWQQRQYDRKELALWEDGGRPVPPPAAFKRKLIREMAGQYGTRVFVETGTHLGHTVAASLGGFDVIYSIELMDELYELARLRFARHNKVKLRHGDSAQELSRILAELSAPAVFWLDAHYSGDGTARAEHDTPILKELQAISHHHVKTHVILIDDARCFNGANDYPTIKTCMSLATTFWPADRFEVADDIIRIVPEKIR